MSQITSDLFTVSSISSLPFRTFQKSRSDQLWNIKSQFFESKL
jgi:hypothetical protein